jgi:hypothetical protein
MGWKNFLFCSGVSDNINVHVALQIAYSSAKPNLDVLGVDVSMIHKSLLYIYKLSYFYLNHLMSLFLFVFFWPCIGCSICGYLFSHSNYF